MSDLIDKVSEHRLLVDIVSSQLDADRMDYLIRDALSTGVKYGAFDSEWLLNSMCVGTEPGESGADDPMKWRLCLEARRGLHSAEQLIVARMHMSLQVYYHRATRGWEAHLLCLFREASKLAEQSLLPTATPAVARKFFAEKGALGAREFLLFDEATLLSAMQVWADVADPQCERLSELAYAFLVREKVFHCKELADLPYRKQIKLTQRLLTLGEEDRDWHTDLSEFVGYKDFDSAFGVKSAGDAGTSTSAILLSDGELGAPTRPIESESLVLRAIGDDGRHSINRLYFHRTLAEKVQNLLDTL